MLYGGCRPLHNLYVLSEGKAKRIQSASGATWECHAVSEALSQSDKLPFHCHSSAMRSAHISSDRFLSDLTVELLRPAMHSHPVVITSLGLNLK